MGTDVIVAGHLCLDVLPSLNKQTLHQQTPIAPGQLIQVGSAAFSTGGAVANTGRALQRLGVLTALVGKLGDDLYGRTVQDLLNTQATALTDFLIIDPEEATSYSIVLSAPGMDRMFFHCPGANDTFLPRDIDWNRFDKARLFHLGYPPLMRSLYSDGGVSCAELFKQAKRHGLTTSLDMAQPDPNTEAGRVDWRAWLQRVLPHVDLFLPSIEEISFMLNMNQGTQKDDAKYENAQCSSKTLTRIATQLLEMGAAVVGLKLGEYGLYLQSSSQEDRFLCLSRAQPRIFSEWVGRALISPCFEVEAVGTTGAGDATIAGFLSAFIDGLGPEASLQRAVAVGACSVEHIDAVRGIPTLREVQNRIDSGWTQRSLGIELNGWHPIGEHGVWGSPMDAHVT